MNICKPGEFTIRPLDELVRARVNPDLPLIEKPLSADDPTQLQLLIDLAFAELDVNSI